LPTPQAGVGVTHSSGRAAFYYVGYRGFPFRFPPSQKKQPAISGGKNGVLLLAKKHAVPSVLSASNRQPARRKAFPAGLPRPRPERSEAMGFLKVPTTFLKIYCPPCFSNKADSYLSLILGAIQKHS
jgi:hypothetical protein